jgi:hypothetical protein
VANGDGWEIVAYGKTRTNKAAKKRLSAVQRTNQSINLQWHNIPEGGARYPTDKDIQKAQWVTVHIMKGTKQGYYNVAILGFESIAEVEEYITDVIMEEYA